MKVVGIITARGGSKGVPRKNLAPLLGRPLLAYTADAALAARRLDRLIVSTDDDEIAAVALDLGLDVPFMRPPELAADATPTLPVLQHAVRFLEDRGEYYDAICILQPTNPLRTGDDIDICIDLLQQHPEADSVVTILPVPCEYNPHWVFWQSESGFLTLATGESAPIPRRQDLPPAFHREGSVYVTRRDIVMIENTICGAHTLGHLLHQQRSVNIDTPADLERASAMLRTQLLVAGAGTTSH